MLTIVWSVCLLVVGIALLLRGADWLVEGSGNLARRFRVSDAVIGLTVVSLGTSAPELLINLVAALREQGDIVLGNIIGSNIANILLVLGAAAAMRRLPFASATAWREIPFAILAAALLWLMGMDAWLDGAPGAITRSEGLVLLALMGAFAVYTLTASRHNRPALGSDPPAGTVRWAVLQVGLGCGALFGGGHLAVIGATDLALTLGVSEKVIALTVLAIGTSLPELVTSVVAARNGRTDMAIGNVIGSCVLNIFFVLGVSAVITPLSCPGEWAVDLHIQVAVVVLLQIAMITGRRQTMDRWEGWGFLALYGVYLAVLVLTP